MKILQIWFLKLFLFNFLRSTVVLVVMFSLFSFSDFIEIFRENPSFASQQFLSIGKLLLLILDSVLPMSFLVSALFTVSPMVHFNELTGIRASGQSVPTVIWPAMVVSLIGVVFSAIMRLGGLTSGPGGIAGSEVGAKQTSIALATAYHANLAFPFLNLLAFLLGVLIASSKVRKQLYGGFISAVLVFILYHIVSSTGLAFGRHGVISPVLAGWSGTIIFSFVLLGFWFKIKL